METTPAESLRHHKIFRILDHLYDKVETLEEFALRVIAEDRLRSPNNINDESYANFLATTLVCFPRGARPLPRRWNVEQQSEQNEVVLRVVERIQRREGIGSSNLLTRGYYAKSEKSGAQISTSSCCIEYGHSNYSTNRLLYPTWKKLLSRVGDDAMEYVLENLVVFLFVSSACYIQLTGTPLYELWPFRRFCARSYQRSAAARRLCNSLLNDSRRKHCRVRNRSENNRPKRTSAAAVAKPSSVQAETISGHQAADVQPASDGELVAVRKRKCVGTIEDEVEQQKKFCNEADGLERGANVAPFLCIKFQPTANENDGIKLCDGTSGSKPSDSGGVVPQGSMGNLVSSIIESFSVLATTDNMSSMEDRCQPSSSSYSSPCNSSASVFHPDDSSCTFLTAPSSARRRNAQSTASPSTGADGLLSQRTDRPAVCEISSPVDVRVRLTAADERTDRSVDVVSSESDRQYIADDAAVDARSRCGGKRRRRVRKGKLSEGERATIGDSVPFSAALAVKRAGLFYSKNFSETFSPRHLLAGFVATHDDAAKLTRQVLETTVDELSSTAMPCGGRVAAARAPECCDAVKERLDKFLRHVIVSHRSCPYRRLLDFHCPTVKRRTAVERSTTERVSSSNDGGNREPDFSGVPAFVRGRKMPMSAGANLNDKLKAIVKRRTSSKYNVSRLLELHSSHRQVYLFVRACCLRVLPTGLFGSTLNRNVFFRNIRKCIGLGRFEQLSLGDLMTKMKVTQCRWMAEIHSNVARLRLLAKLVCWLLNSYVIVLIRSYFYVTDTAVYRNRVFYYRKGVWKKIHRKVYS